MRRSRFEQLVNLYLDGEITKTELRWLRRELLRCPEHRDLFVEYWRLHKATCKAQLASLDELVRTHVGGQSRSFGSWFSYASIGAAAAVLVLGVTSLSQIERHFSNPSQQHLAGQGLALASEEPKEPLMLAPPLEITPVTETTFARINLLTEQEFEQLVLHDASTRGETAGWNQSTPLFEGQPVRLSPTIPFGATIETSPAGRLIVQQRTPYNGFKLITIAP